MKGLEALKFATVAGGMVLAGAACDEGQSNTRQTVAGALTNGQTQVVTGNNCFNFAVIGSDAVCTDYTQESQRLIVVRDFSGAASISNIAGSEGYLFPANISGKLGVAVDPFPNLSNDVYRLDICDLDTTKGLLNCKEYAQDAIGLSDRSLDSVTVSGNEHILSLTASQQLYTYEGNEVWSKIDLVGFPNLEIESVHPYEGEDMKDGDVLVTMYSAQTQIQAAARANLDLLAGTLTKVGGNYQDACMKTGKQSRGLRVLKVNGGIYEMKVCSGTGLMVTKLSGDTPVPDKDPLVDAGVIEDTKGDAAGDTADDTVPDANDIGPGEVDAVGDAVPDGVDTDDNGSTEDVKPDLSQPDAEVQELPQEEVSSPDGETDNGQEVVTDVTTEDGDGGEGPDIIEVSETDGSNGPDATPDVVVKNVCEQLGAVVNQPQVTLSVENGECVVTTENADGEVRVDFIGGDATGFITVKPKNAGEVARFSDGATSIPTGSVLNGLNATLTGSGTIEDGLNGGFMSSAVPGAKTTTTVIGGANVGDVPNGTTIKTVDGVTEVTAGPTDGVRVIATCLSNGKIIDIQLEAGESNKKDPCAEDVIPPKPSSGGGCNVAGEGNHKNGVGDLGAELLLGLVGLFAVNRRRLAKVLGFA